ncbi:Ca2+/Na+ antiporter [Hyphomicrobium denitrificans 1NES1]|uniref:Ca2+/Na+ antiporter n=1 Tax=Hyphomicrobium denitrificans 1NES1 TaxID=670307 RepID=N0BBX2_9HYPH|nr:sodium/hydrogen exchanger [Hyphomicrobium denitrificans]AGK59767.1 Ca2+/Na+ antiporter [Hyphomicrobium denitrificans 1NES1]
MIVVWILAFLAGVALIVWGAEAFAEHLGAASVRLGVSAFALALLLAGAEPEELATVVVASLRGSPGIAFGDVIGANVAICLVALGVGAVIAPLPFRTSVMRYAILGLPLGAIAAWIAWDGVVTRLEGAILVGLYIVYVGTIWIVQRRPPALGEVHELEEAENAASNPGGRRRISRELLLVLAGVAAMAAGASLLVEAMQQITHVESTQTSLGLTLVGFATAFELVVLAWSAARRGASEAVVAGVVGSFAYNVTMTLGAGALARPLAIVDAASLHFPWLAMLAALLLVVVLAAPKASLSRVAGVVLLGAYPLFVLAVLLA